MSIFEQATRQKLRFPTPRGQISAEDLWDLPLSSKSGFDLDNIAKTVNTSLKAAGEESFVAVTTSPAKTLLQLQMEVIKHVIAVRLDENKAQRERADRAAERARLVEILGQKQDEALRSLSPEEIQKRLDALKD